VNRNGDGFKEAACRSYHNTFVTKPVTKEGAYWYKNHQNKNPLKSYGIVKASMFNEDMKRIELLVALNGTKEAAERNNGLVAEDEIEKLASGREIPVSMACKIARDQCSGCGNWARTRAEYCDETNCKYGGLKNNMAKVAEDGHILHADNPHPNFFDISNVYRPADRIAYVLGHAKVASHNRVMGGAELAEMWGLAHPLGEADPSDPKLATLLKLAQDLAQIEERIQASPASMSDDLSRALDTGLRRGQIDFSFIKTSSARERAIGALTSSKISLSLEDFLKVNEKNPDLAQKAAAYLPGVYTRLLSDPQAESLLLSTKEHLKEAQVGMHFLQWSEKHAADRSFGQSSVRLRMKRSALNSLAIPAPKYEKSASEKDPTCEAIAREYALYKLAFLAAHSLDGREGEELKELAVRQNYLQ
jgi:hypothetical protein